MQFTPGGGGGGGGFNSLYSDVCIEGLKKDPLRRTQPAKNHTHNEGILYMIHTHI